MKTWIYWGGIPALIAMVASKRLLFLPPRVLILFGLVVGVFFVSLKRYYDLTAAAQKIKKAEPIEPKIIEATVVDSKLDSQERS